jgi:serine/threonine protein kinase
MKYEIDEIDIVKKIGSGSFSNVYLCKNGCIDNESLMFFAEDIREMYYIVKEININVLVKRYLNQNRITQRTLIAKKNDSPVNPNITPFSRKEYTVSIDNNENDYYYCRLKELIESEVDIMKFIEHKNIVKFYNSCNRDGVYYLYMEYCNEGDVYNLLKKSGQHTRNNLGGFTNGFVYNFIKQVVEGFIYMHDKHIIHRDVKLHNILLKSTGNVGMCFKISDFGFACFDLKEVEQWDDSLGKKYFKLCGTPYYMAPELILHMDLLENFTKYQNGRKNRSILFYDTKVDIWSFGICIYELITNSLPFPVVKGVKDLEVFFKGSAQSIGTAQEFIDKKIETNKIIDPIIRRLLKSLLKVDPNERFTAREVKEYILKYQTPILDVPKESLNTIQKDLMEATIDNDHLKKHIVSNPIGESWEKINRSSSILLDCTSVEKGFLDWLKKKK